MLFIKLLFCKLQDVLILITCFGRRVNIIRSTRAIMYMFLLCNDIFLWKVMESHYVFLHCAYLVIVYCKLLKY